MGGAAVLNILAVRKESVRDIMASHWQEYGRNYYSRHDYEAVDSAKADALMSNLRARLDALAGNKFGELEVLAGDEFSYLDPVDGSLSERQGVRIHFKGGSRAVLRLSGTGTQGATLRVYLEQYVASNPDNPTGLFMDTQEALAAVRTATDEIAWIRQLGRDEPDVMT